MLEPLVRNHLDQLHAVYDRCPSPARHLLTSARGWVLTRIRYSSQTLDLLQQLRGNESWSHEEIAAHQCAQVRATLEHARRFVPFYRSYPALPLHSLDELRKLPVLRRETVRGNPGAFVSNSENGSRRIYAGTTGTTGTNLKVAYDDAALSVNWAFLLRQWAWAGIAPRSPRLTLFGARIVPARRAEPPYWTFNIPERQLLLSIFHLSHRTAVDYLACLRRHQGKVLEGFPSVLAILADFAAESRQQFPMRVIFTSGEPLYPQVRAKIESVFQAAIFDSYGMTELCGLIQQCEFGEMHLAPEYGYLEILNEADESVAPEQEGHLVWTGFINRTMPLIRYRIGDRGMWKSGRSCKCGRAFPRVTPTITRESDLLRTPDGRHFSPRALNQLLKQTTALRFCQFIQAGADSVVVRGVPSSARAEQDVKDVCARLRNTLGASMQVDFELVEAPISKAGGKIPLIVSQVPQ